MLVKTDPLTKAETLLEIDMLNSAEAPLSLNDDEALASIDAISWLAD